MVQKLPNTIKILYYFNTFYNIINTIYNLIINEVKNNDKIVKT